MNEGKHAQRGSGFFGGFLSLVIMVVVVLAASWALRTYVVEPFQVPTSSMEPTIQGHDASATEAELKDMIFSEKVSYLLGSPKRGDIVTFTDPQIASRTLIKRVIATEGQTVDLVCDGTDASGKKHYVVYVDGVQLDEPYVARQDSGEIASSSPLSTASGVSISYPYTVPAGCVWVMGDNREHSADSRYFGAIPTSSVFGRAFMVYWPIQDIKLLS